MSLLKIAAAVLDFSDDKTIGFVVSDSGSPIAGDASIKAHIEARGYTVTYIDDDSVTGNEVYDAFIISDSVISSKVSNKFAANTAGIISIEFLNWVTEDLCDITGTDSGETQWDLILDSHPIGNGYSNGLITVFSSGTTVRHAVSTSNIGDGATVVFDSPDGTSRPSIFVYETGALMVSGTAAGRRASFPLEQIQWSISTSDAKAIFDNALDWALGLI